MEYPKIEEINCSNCTERSIKVHYPEFWKYVKENFHCDKWTEKLYWFYHHLDDYPKCSVCGKPTQFINLKTGYREFCGYKCMNSCNDVQIRKKETSMKNWGTDNPMQSKMIKEKLKTTIQNRYGVDNPFQMVDFEEKRKATNLKKYGVEHHLQNAQILDKQMRTNIQRYGTPYISQIDSYKKIIQNTCNERYGGIGNQSPMLLKKYRKSIHTKNINNYDFLLGYTDEGDWICKCPHPDCNLCTNKTYITNDLIQYSRSRLGVECCTTLYPVDNHRCKNTSIELFIQNILDRYNIEYQTNVRDIIPPKELDIYIPSKKIAIECNGIYSHSIMYKKQNYHLEKTRKCRECGVDLIHIWEDWIKYKPEIVESIILNKLGMQESTIYARKTIIKMIDSKTCNMFLDQNHIQGGSVASIHLGLYYESELVSVMTFSKPRVNMGNIENINWELIRFCSKINMRVIGGASKLLKYFIKTYNPINIISFSSNDISNGNLYKQLGFTTDEKYNSSYWYIEPKTFKRYHRSSFTKQQIVKKGFKDKIDSSWTEREVMGQLGYFCIYDSGQYKWTLKLTKTS